VITTMAITAPATPDELRTRLTATPSADAVKATPIRASLGTIPAGVARGIRQMSQCTT
jgi:hypothetical protein